MSNAKKWNIKQADRAKILEIAQDLQILPITATLLYTRGFTESNSARQFLKKETELFHSPYLLRDMEKAVARIREAVEQKEKIVIYGDYDVDGVTSVSTLYRYLQEKGACISYYIPNRIGEGYGINCAAIQTLAEKGTRLILTVDTGITAMEETAYANTLGMDMIITDHHECRPELPPAIAVINPKRPDCSYPFQDLAGVGVVFKLVCALEEAYCSTEDEKKECVRKICLRYGDLVAIGTVADVMPLVDENRLIVSIGLRIIEQTKNCGLKALLDASSGTDDGKTTRKYPKKRKVTSSLIGFGLAPRINAAGRIRTASKAVELFLTQSDKEAVKIAEELCEINRERQIEENHIMEQATEKIKQEHNFDKDWVIVLAEDHWNHGVIGIVSSRITEQYNLPSLLISFEDNIGKGSGRSIKGLNLVDALVSCQDLLLKYGGHELAAGLSIEREKLPELKRRINDYAREHLKREDFITSIDIDCEMEITDLTLQTANELYLLEPFGVSNPVPLFVIREMEIIDCIPLRMNRHTKFIFKKGKTSVTALYFGVSSTDLDFYVGDKVDVVFQLDINEFQNVQTVQMIIRDIAHAESDQAALLEQKKIYKALKEDRPIYKEEDFVPTREDFVSVYLYIKQALRGGKETFTIHAIEKNGSIPNCKNLCYIKIKFILHILLETNILGVERISLPEDAEELYCFQLHSVKDKINLEKSNVYRIIKNKREKN